MEQKQYLSMSKYPNSSFKWTSPIWLNIIYIFLLLFKFNGFLFLCGFDWELDWTIKLAVSILLRLILSSSWIQTNISSCIFHLSFWVWAYQKKLEVGLTLGAQRTHQLYVLEISLTEAWILVSILYCTNIFIFDVI